MTALEAKNNFGQLLDATQREPVMVTKNNRPVATLISVSDIEVLAKAFLPASDIGLKTSAELVSSLMRQAEIDERIAMSRVDRNAGRLIEMDNAFFDELRTGLESRARRWMGNQNGDPRFHDENS